MITKWKDKQQRMNAKRLYHSSSDKRVPMKSLLFCSLKESDSLVVICSGYLWTSMTVQTKGLPTATTTADIKKQQLTFASAWCILFNEIKWVYTQAGPFHVILGAWYVLFNHPPHPLSGVLVPCISRGSVVPLKWINHIWIIKLEVISQLAGDRGICQRKLGMVKISSWQLAKQHLNPCNSSLRIKAVAGLCESRVWQEEVSV